MKKLIRTIACLTALAVILLVAYNFFNSFFIEKEFTEGDYSSYYYRQLDKTEKQAYTAVKEKIYDFPKEIESPVLTTSQLEDVLNALIYDDPMMFMMSNCKLVMQGRQAFFVPSYCMDSEEYSHYEEKINKKLDKIAKEIPTNDFEAELFCHDYIIENCDYSDTDHILESTVVGVLINGKAKCSGYAKAFKLLLDRADIESVLITGAATDFSGKTQNHMWNAVKIGNSWCYTDPTWDDPLTEDGEAVCRHIYFNMTEEMLSRTHNEFEFIEECNDPSLYYYIIYDAYFDKCGESLVSSVSDLIAEAARSGRNEAEFMLSSDSVMSQALIQLFEEERIYRALETAALKTGMSIVTDSLNYSANLEERLITIIFETKG